MPINTTQNWLFDEAPPKVSLKGDKKRKPEPSTHIIEFPGGAVEVSRTGDGNYWAHIMLQHDYALSDCEGRASAIGEVIGSRIDYEHPADPNIIEVPNAQAVRQIAILIKPRPDLAK